MVVPCSAMMKAQANGSPEPVREDFSSERLKPIQPPSQEMASISSIALLIAGWRKIEAVEKSEGLIETPRTPKQNGASVRHASRRVAGSLMSCVASKQLLH